MANNLDAAALAVRSAYPKNRIMLDDKGLPSVMVFIPKFRLYEVMGGGEVETHQRASVQFAGGSAEL